MLPWEGSPYRGTRRASKKHWVIFSRYSSFVSALEGAGAVALISGEGGFKSQGMHLTHTGSLIFAREASLPIISIAAED
jgi:hypothetical protein